MVLSDLLENEYFPRKRSISSDSTKKHYRITIAHLGLMLGRPATLADLDEDVAERFIVWCQNHRKLARATIHQRRCYLVAFWGWCAKRRMVEKWPTVEPVAVPRHVPEAWTLDELERLMAACRACRGHIGDVRANLWWPSIHAFWFYEGERVSASLSARWADYHDGILMIPAERRKGQSKPAVYDLHPIVRDWLDLIRQPARELIWPWPYDRSRFYQLYRELIESAALPWKPRTGPQKLRRTHATYVLASGGDPTASLMHSSPDVTQRFYLDTRIVRPQPQNRQLPRVG